MSAPATPRSRAWVGALAALALIVAALAGLAAVTGICVGCEMYLWLARLRGRPLAPVGSA